MMLLNEKLEASPSAQPIDTSSDRKLNADMPHLRLPVDCTKPGLGPKLVVNVPTAGVAAAKAAALVRY